MIYVSISYLSIYTHTHTYYRQNISMHLHKYTSIFTYAYNEAKAYVMKYDYPEEVPDSDSDEPTLMDLEEDDGSAFGGGLIFPFSLCSSGSLSCQKNARCSGVGA